MYCGNADVFMTLHLRCSAGKHINLNYICMRETSKTPFMETIQISGTDLDKAASELKGVCDVCRSPNVSPYRPKTSVGFSG